LDILLAIEPDMIPDNGRIISQSLPEKTFPVHNMFPRPFLKIHLKDFCHASKWVLLGVI
jgi:hypothetical protein